MTSKGQNVDDFDSPWKEILDAYFPQFLEYCLPKVHADIDWSRGFEPLDKELQQIEPENEEGRRYVDKLFKVWKLTGEEEWVLIHIEMQNQPSDDFPRRMYVYNYRSFDRYGRKVVSIAVLGDDNPNWRPDQFHYDLWGCRVELRFPVIKLLDYSERASELEKSQNPIALIILAHLKAVETRRNGESRLAWKSHLVRVLYEYGWDANRVRQLFRFIDWLMKLPREFEIQFRDDLTILQQEKHMPYVTSIERLAREEGLEQGLEQGIEQGIEQGLEQGIERGRVTALQDSIIDLIEFRFEIAVSPEVAFSIRQLQSLPRLREIQRHIVKADTLESVLNLVRQACSPN